MLAEPKLTLKRALDLAIAIETSEKDALNLQKSKLPGENVIHKLDDTVRDTVTDDTVTDETPRDRTLFISAAGVMGDIALLNVVLRKLNVMHVIKLVTYPKHEAKGRGSKRGPIRERKGLRDDPPITFLSTARTVTTPLMKRVPHQHTQCLHLVRKIPPHTK